MNTSRNFVTARTLHRAFNGVATPLPVGTEIRVTAHPVRDGRYVGKWVDSAGRAWRVQRPDGGPLQLGHDVHIMPTLSDLKAMLL